MIQRYKYPLIIISKLLIVSLAFWVIYGKLSGSITAPEIQSFLLKQFTPSFYWGLLLLILMMPLNWFLEAYRWRLLVQKLEPIPVFYSLKAIVSGSTLGIFTPNRIGDIAGRALFLKPENRIRAMVCTAIGSFSHMIIIIGLGLLSAIYFCIQFVELEHQLFYVLLYVVGVLLILLLFFYFNISWFSFITERWVKSEKIRKVFAIMNGYTTGELAVILFLGFMRHIVYTTQYIGLILFFIPEVSWLDTMVMVNLIFFVQSVVPSFAMADLGIRGATSIYFMAFITTNLIAVLAASVIIWCVNIMLPALVGAIFFIQQRFFDDGVRAV